MRAEALSTREAEGEIRVFAQYERDFVEEADVVVVGSGPSGSVVTYELAKAGHRVLLVEEGPPFTPKDFRIDGNVSMARTMREGGLRSTTGTFMPVMQAICLGGASLINSAMCVRPPKFVFDDWSTRFDLERTTRGDLDPHYDAVGEFLGIAPTPDAVQGRRNMLFREGCDALGYSSEPVPRNVQGCRGSGECFTGCRPRAKQSMDISYIPEAMKLGARVLTSLQVQRVLGTRRRVWGVEGQVVEPFTGRASHAFRINARLVVLAAGCMATPVLLQRSGDLANESRQVGQNLQFHPGCAVAGVFPDEVDPLFGATQSYHSLDFLREGFKLETMWSSPAALAVRTPGMGADLLRHLGELPRTVIWDAIGSTHRSVGSVRARSEGLDPVIRWSLNEDDAKLMLRAVHVLTEIFFAAGAEKVMPGVHGLPEEITSTLGAQAIGDHPIRPRDLVMASSHVFCTTRMHGDAAKGVVDEIGRCHGFDNLFIADTGIFPRCPSVNPMYTVMALAHRQAQAIREQI
ncbi:MAG: GMC family oxidoreductase [Deltaproteobacteria bacterium]|nr:GMC family oxidoreductase [Deltaproteobacteria bacterium]